MNNLPGELIEIIRDYTVGDKHWKYNYRDCIKDFNDMLKFDEDADDIADVDALVSECNSNDFWFMLSENLTIFRVGHVLENEAEWWLRRLRALRKGNPCACHR